MAEREAVQREITALLLTTLGGSGFALAGAGAIREHGLTNRPTEDIDLFGLPLTNAQQFADAVELVEATLVAKGYTVVRLRSFDQFARLHLAKDEVAVLEVDLALNWRTDSPVEMGIGPVLSERDAVAGKLSAVYSRGEVRDFLDLDSIRLSGRYSDAELLELGRQHDDGFAQATFAVQLARVDRFLPSEAAHYGITAEKFLAIQERLITWATELDTAD